MVFSITWIKTKIINRLVRWNKWGGSHTENVLKGLPKHFIGHKITRETIKELVREEWLLAEIKTGEVHYSLNPRKVNEIMGFYEKYYNRNL